MSHVFSPHSPPRTSPPTLSPPSTREPGERPKTPSTVHFLWESWKFERSWATYSYHYLIKTCCASFVREHSISSTCLPSLPRTIQPQSQFWTTSSSRLTP